MGAGLRTENPIIVGAFRTALLHQFLVVVLVGVVLGVLWNIGRTVSYRRATATGSRWAGTPGSWAGVEPPARRFLRITFGLLWVIDGLLQIQWSMPLGLPDGVLTPAAASSPSWLRHLVASGAGIWSNHPVTAAAATVWIQVGIGFFLLVTRHGTWSRAAGAISAGWGLLVWVFGEALGGVLGPGVSWLYGAPGSVLFYAVAGTLVALPDRWWEGARLGRWVLRTMGAMFVAFGVLQAWPGRGSWSSGGTAASAASPLTTYLSQMAHMSQPSVTAAMMRAVGSFQAGHGWLVNLVVVVLLVGVGVAWLSDDVRVNRAGLVVGWIFCAASWVLVQDFGVLGGLGTDPNSMIPMALLASGAYLAVVRPAAREERAPSDVTAGATTVSTAADPVGRAAADGPRSRPVRERLAALDLNVPLRSLLAAGAAAVILIGAAPMVAAATDPNADPLLIEAVNGQPTYVDAPAPPFTLTDTRGRAVSLASLRGRTVVLTFLDPVCTSDCPVIAQDLRVADRQLGATTGGVELVAVNANPLYTGIAFTAAFDREEGLNDAANWTYLTGNRTQLEEVWNAYGVPSELSPAGGMVAHSDIVYLINRLGHTRVILNADPGDGSAQGSSFIQQLTQQIADVARR